MTVTFAERALVPLPQRVKPFPGEDISTYLDRLAYANRLHPDALCGHITGTKRTRNVPLDRLAIVAGIPAEILARAIIDTGREPARQLHVKGPACQLCAAAKGGTRSVECWKPAERVICLRHRRWIASPHALQPSLDHQPDIIRAHRQHLRLVRRFGREEVASGFSVAASVCQDWHHRHQHAEGLHRRLFIFHGSGWGLHADDPTLDAAGYPQVVALARLLTSPYWHNLAVGESSAGQALFAQELRRTVAPAYQWPQPRGSKDPLYQRIIGDPLFGRARRRTGAPSITAEEPWMSDDVTDSQDRPVSA